MADPKVTFNFVLGRVVLTLLSILFLWFGIDLLIAAYRLKTPFEFIATFFASNLIILISAVLGLGFVLSLIRRFRGVDEAGETGDEPQQAEPEKEVPAEKGPEDAS